MAEDASRTVRILDSPVGQAPPNKVFQIQGRDETGTSVLNNRPGMTFHSSPADARVSGDCDVIMSQTVYRQVLDHLSRDTSREHGGLLLGYELEGSASERAVFVMHSLPARYTDGTATSLNIKEDSWAEWDKLSQEYAPQGPSMRRVGWYHSHPNIRIFLSKWDLDVCQEFKRPTQVALVVDPIGKRGGFFVRGQVGFRSHAPQSFWEMHDLSPASVVEWTNVNQVEGLDPSTKESDEGAVEMATSPVLQAANSEEPNAETPTELTGAARDTSAAGEAIEKLTASKKQSVKPRRNLRPPTSELLVWLIAVLGVGVFSMQVWSILMLRAVTNNIQRWASDNSQTSTARLILPVEPAPTVGKAETPLPPAQALPPATTALQVAVTPAQATLGQSESKQFKAKVQGDSNKKVHWSINPAGIGKINDAGVYKAPATIAKLRTVMVMATSQADSTRAASATVSLTPPQPPAQSSASEPPAPDRP